MKKAILLLLVLLSLGASLFALDSNTWYIGLSGDYTYNRIISNTGYRINTELDGGHGFSITVQVRYQFSSMVGIETGVRYTQKNWVYLHMVGSKTESTFHINSFFEIPLAVNLSFDLDAVSVVTSLGMYVGVWGMHYSRDTYCDISLEGLLISSAGFIDFDSNRDNRFELGFLARVGIEYPIDSFVLFTRGSYYLSVTDLNKKYQADLVSRYNHSLSAEVGFIVGLGGKR